MTVCGVLCYSHRFPRHLFVANIRVTTKGASNPDVIYGLDFVLIHMDCSTVIALMTVHKVRFSVLNSVLQCNLFTIVSYAAVVYES